MRKFVLIITKCLNTPCLNKGKPSWAYSLAFLLDVMIVDGISPSPMDITLAIRCVTMIFVTTVQMFNLKGVYNNINYNISSLKTENYEQTDKILTDHNQTL